VAASQAIARFEVLVLVGKDSSSGAQLLPA